MNSKMYYKYGHFHAPQGGLQSWGLCTEAMWASFGLCSPLSANVFCWQSTMTPPKIIGPTHPLLVCYPSRRVRIVLLTTWAPLLTTCKNLYSYATSPTMTENLCPDQGKKRPTDEWEYDMSGRPCSCAVRSPSDQIYRRHQLSHEPRPSHATCVARHICQAEGTKAVVATTTSEQRPSALVVGWSSSSCANRRKNLLLRKQKGKPCFPMMDPSLRCSLSSCMTPWPTWKVAIRVCA